MTALRPGDYAIEYTGGRAPVYSRLSLAGDGTWRLEGPSPTPPVASSPSTHGWYHVLDACLLLVSGDRALIDVRIGGEPGGAARWLRLERGRPTLEHGSVSQLQQSEGAARASETGLTALHRACMALAGVPAAGEDAAASSDDAFAELERALESCDLAATTSPGGLTALHLGAALGAGHRALLALVEAGAPLQAVDAQGWTPLHHLWTDVRPGAREAETLALFASLQAAGGRIDTPDPVGRTPWDLLLSTLTHDNAALLKKIAQRFKRWEELSNDTQRIVRSAIERGKAGSGAD